MREDGRLVTRLVDLDRDAALIPNMPIHFNRDINSGYSYNPQTDMLPLFGGKDAKGALAAEIAAEGRRKGSRTSWPATCSSTTARPRASGARTRNSSPARASTIWSARILPRRVHRRPGGQAM